MNSVQNGRITDCVLFKQELHENSYKRSGAHNFTEYINYVNDAFLKSEWHKKANVEKEYPLVSASLDPFYSAKNQAVLNEAIEQLEAGKGLVEKTWDELEAMEYA